MVKVAFIKKGILQVSKVGLVKVAGLLHLFLYLIFCYIVLLLKDCIAILKDRKTIWPHFDIQFEKK